MNYKAKLCMLDFDVLIKHFDSVFDPLIVFLTLNAKSFKQELIFFFNITNLINLDLCSRPKNTSRVVLRT